MVRVNGKTVKYIMAAIGPVLVGQKELAAQQREGCAARPGSCRAKIIFGSGPKISSAWL